MHGEARRVVRAASSAREEAVPVWEIVRQCGSGAVDGTDWSCGERGGAWGEGIEESARRRREERREERHGEAERRRRTGSKGGVR